MSIELPLSVDPSAPIPLATQLSQQITWLIVSGSLAEGDELPAVRRLADRLGINLHTVRAAYRQVAANALLSVEPGRRARVLRFDRAAARPSAGVLSFSLGVIIPEFVPFYAPLLRGIEAAAAERPAMVFVCNSHEDEETALGYLDRLIAKQVDGVVMASFAPTVPDLRLPHRPPIVFVDSPGAPGPGVDFAHEAGQFAVTRHLIEHGHQRIGFLTPPRWIPTVSLKYAGFERALEASGLMPDPELVVEVPDFEVGSGTEGAARLLDLADPPTAIAAASDPLAFGAYDAIAGRGLHLPRDVAVVGNDDIEMAAIIRPPLTTVSMPIEEAGSRAVAMLEQLLDGDEPEPRRLILETELVIRETCGCTPTG